MCTKMTGALVVFKMISSKTRYCVHSTVIVCVVFEEQLADV